MRFAYQTIIYGKKFGQSEDESRDVISNAARDLRHAGFQGIELFQSPNNLGTIKYTELIELLGPELPIIGLSGGRLEERMQFLGEERGPYLYTDTFPEEEVRECLRRNFRVAIHPHAFKPIHNLAAVLELYKSNEWKNYFKRGLLQLLPDTAHAHIVGDDAFDCCMRFRAQLAGLHVKGWRSAYGRMSHRYSQGFCNIDEGDAPVRSVLEGLLREEFPNPCLLYTSRCV